ncbi:kanadaptin [Anastrepha ludens]|uniref:kanadaptin n=1 Tax=Anastrepha ludens TaxID=28586 RepID=UPI0023B116E5|nr:kanadaptin [Anastrepha ludens]XP_053945898.1 kanadaptin [Anastrepha ludens]
MDEFKIPLLPTTATSKANKDSDPTTNEPKEEDKQQSKKDATSTTDNDCTAKPACPYKVPPWSQPPPASINYRFEILKSGQIIDEIKNLQAKAFWKFGRLPPPANDLELAHPTISRFHAILQYRPKNSTQSDGENASNKLKDEPPEGWYIYDLNSTHGTFLNKQRIPPHVFIRIRVGHMLRLGASTRSYILQGPEEDAEPESDLTVTELREQHKEKLIAAEAEAIRKAAEAEERERNEGINWGMGEEADEETDLTHNPFASTNNEELFLDDPKKTLRGYFEREGMELEYKCDEMSAGSFVCRVELPLSDAFGRPIVAEVVHKGRKKECVVQCALEACRILDRHGVLRQANQEPLRRKVKPQSDSEEDDFLDRTGDVERKKQRKSNPSTNSALTYEDLLKKDSEIVGQLKEVEDDILRYQDTQRRLKAFESNNSDDLDHFMENLTDATQLDKTEIRKLRLEQQRLNAEKQKVQRLIKIAKPIDFKFESIASAKISPNTKRQLPIIGKRNQFSKFKIAKIVKSNKIAEIEKHTNLASDEEEIEEEDEITLHHAKATKSTIAQGSPISVEEGEIKPETTNEEPLEATSNSPNSTKKIYGPAVVPQEILESNVQDMLEERQDTKLPTECTSINGGTEMESARKKRRQRQRQRQKRQDADMNELEEHESSEKYAKWVPPSNQSGDGYTELNAKYGY